MSFSLSNNIIMWSLLLLVDYCFHWLTAWIDSYFFYKVIHRRTRKAVNPAKYSHVRNRKKAPWVIEKVLYIKAVSGFGCGKVSEVFNQLYGHKETVSKTFVYEKLLKHQYELTIIKRNIKKKKPKTTPINQTWGLDLTKVRLNNKQKVILGIIDHGSRFNLNLSELSSKHSARITLELTQAIKQIGFPKLIRTDNESCFNSTWIKVCLTLLGIEHQKTKVAAPWQNGRIERFFGTFKLMMNRTKFISSVNLQDKLNTYRVWYNQIRPHQNLSGLTPAEVWSGKLKRHKSNVVEVSDWDGVLTGYYFPD